MNRFLSDQNPQKVSLNLGGEASRVPNFDPTANAQREMQYSQAINEVATSLITGSQALDYRNETMRVERASEDLGIQAEEKIRAASYDALGNPINLYATTEGLDKINDIYRETKEQTTEVIAGSRLENQDMNKFLRANDVNEQNRILTAETKSHEVQYAIRMESAEQNATYAKDSAVQTYSKDGMDESTQNNILNKVQYDMLGLEQGVSSELIMAKGGELTQDLIMGAIQKGMLEIEEEALQTGATNSAMLGEKIDKLNDSWFSEDGYSEKGKRKVQEIKDLIISEYEKAGFPVDEEFLKNMDTTLETNLRDNYAKQFQTQKNIYQQNEAIALDEHDRVTRLNHLEIGNNSTATVGEATGNYMSNNDPTGLYRSRYNQTFTTGAQVDTSQITGVFGNNWGQGGKFVPQLMPNDIQGLSRTQQEMYEAGQGVSEWTDAVNASLEQMFGGDQHRINNAKMQLHAQGMYNYTIDETYEENPRVADKLLKIENLNLAASRGRFAEPSHSITYSTLTGETQALLRKYGVSDQAGVDWFVETSSYIAQGDPAQNINLTEVENMDPAKMTALIRSGKLEGYIEKGFDTAGVFLDTDRYDQQQPDRRGLELQSQSFQGLEAARGTYTTWTRSETMREALYNGYATPQQAQQIKQELTELGEFETRADDKVDRMTLFENTIAAYTFDPDLRGAAIVKNNSNNVTNVAEDSEYEKDMAKGEIIHFLNDNGMMYLQDEVSAWVDSHGAGYNSEEMINAFIESMDDTETQQATADTGNTEGATLGEGEALQPQQEITPMLESPPEKNTGMLKHLQNFNDAVDMGDYNRMLQEGGIAALGGTSAIYGMGATASISQIGVLAAAPAMAKAYVAYAGIAALDSFVDLRYNRGLTTQQAFQVMGASYKEHIYEKGPAGLATLPFANDLNAFKGVKDFWNDVSGSYDPHQSEEANLDRALQGAGVNQNRYYKQLGKEGKLEQALNDYGIYRDRDRILGN